MARTWIPRPEKRERGERAVSLVKGLIRDTAYGNGLTTAFRIAIGIVFLYSGIWKLIDPEAFGRSIQMYGVLPDILVPYGAILLSALEPVVGILLLIGYRIRAASLLSLLLLGVFLVAIILNYIRGERFECGCFELSRFGLSEEIGLGIIARDLFFMILVYIVFRAKRHVLSLEAAIDRERLRNI